MKGKIVAQPKKTTKTTKTNKNGLSKQKLLQVVLPIVGVLLIATISAYMLGRSSAAGQLQEISVIQGHNCVQQTGKKLPTLGEGNQGECVKAVQIGINNRLAFISWTSGGKVPYQPIATDGIYGAATKQKVIEYQTANKLTADGVVGTNFWNTFLSDCTVTKTSCVVSGVK